MDVLDVAPQYRDFLQRVKLTTPQAILQLSGVIYCGHPDRHVATLTLADDNESHAVFLKKEHRVPWRERLSNWLAGFGFISKSRREFAFLQKLSWLGIPCPEAISAGEDEHGRAFLLMAKIEGAVELRTYLQQCTCPTSRRHVARELGRTLAQVHNAGVDHPDLYSKHILVSGADGKVSFTLLDWQRSSISRCVPWRQRYRDLAALDATLAEELASPRDRLVFLKSYLQFCSDQGNLSEAAHRRERAAHEVSGRSYPLTSCAALKSALKTAARQIRARGMRLCKRRRIRELRQPPLPAGLQNLIWLDGEALCITRQFREELKGILPEYLRDVYGLSSTDALPHTVYLPANPRKGWLFRRREKSSWKGLWSLLQRRRITTPELQQAGTIFRLERYRVKVPRLLAVGQRQSLPWQVESFVLIEAPGDEISLSEWWQQKSRDFQERRQIIRQVADCLRSIHEAGCILGDNELVIRRNDAGQAEIGLRSVANMHIRRLGPTHIRVDLQRFWQKYAPLTTRTERLRFLLHYLQAMQVTPAVRDKVFTLAKRRRAVA